MLRSRARVEVNGRRAAGRRPWGRAALIVAMAAGLTGCDSLLDVDIPSQVVADDLNNPNLAQLMVTSVVTDFECAFGRYVLGSGIHGNIYADAQNALGSYWTVDRRATTDLVSPIHASTCDTGGSPESFPGIYNPLQVARFQGDDVANRLEVLWADTPIANRELLTATAKAHSGYALVLLAESYCSMAIDAGPELTRAAAFTEAETRLTAAIGAAQAAGSSADAIRHMALLGRARARLSLAVANGQVVNPAKLAEAGADAALIPAGYVRNATFANTVPRRYNSIVQSTNINSYFTVEEGYRGVAWAGVADPRVPVTDAGRNGQNALTPLWLQQKYQTTGTSIPIARSAEAQLIVAEAQGGQVAIDIINALHAATGIPPFAGGTPAEIRAQVIEERRRELFLESHHLGDLLRYALPFTPAAGTAYPQSAGGGVYGNVTCLPLPLAEKDANPNM